MLCKQSKTTSGLNYTTGSPQKMVSLECSANKVMEYKTGRIVVIHINHPLVNNDLVSSVSSKLPENVNYADLGSTGKRFNTLNASLDGLTQPVTVEMAKTIFNREPVCVILRGAFGFIVGCSIMELEQPSIHISAGPPDRTPFHTFQFH